MDVVLECLALREQRVSVDMVRDEVEAELNKVCTSIDRNSWLKLQHLVCISVIVGGCFSKLSGM